MFKENSISVVSIVLNNFTNDSRVLKEAKTLQKNKYNVTVVALHDNSLKEFEIIDGFNVHRIKIVSRSWFKLTAVQFIKYAEFIFRTVKKYKGNDVFHCHDLNALPIGVIIKVFFNRKAQVIYDAHEYETETNGLNGLRKKSIQILERLIIKHADAVITVSDSIASEYVRLYNIPKPSLVLNTPPYKKTKDRKDIFRKTLNISQDKTIILFQGALSRGRGIKILLDAFEKVSSKDKVVIVFMGYGELEALIQRKSKIYDCVFFHEAVEPHVLFDYTSSADIGINGLVTADNCLSYYYSLPNKLFEYMMANLPIIVSDAYEMKKIVIAHDLGGVLSENTSSGLKEVIAKIAGMDKEKLQKNIQKAKKIYCWEEQERVLLKVYEGLHD